LFEDYNSTTLVLLFKIFFGEGIEWGEAFAAKWEKRLQDDQETVVSKPSD